MLDKEQQNLDLAYGTDSRGERGVGGNGSSSGGHSNRPSSSGSSLGIGGGGLKSKSHSEQSFENVQYDEAEDRTHTTPGRDPRSTSGGWIPAGVSGWFAGGSPPDAVRGGDARRGEGPGYGHEERSERERKRDSGDTLTSKGWSAARDITDEISRGMSSGYEGSRDADERRR